MKRESTAENLHLVETPRQGRRLEAVPTMAVPPGETPELGVVPERHHAWAIRRERHGEPLQSFQQESLPVTDPGPGEVLVQVMAAGVNFNGVWAGLGKPVSVFDVHKQQVHVAGSDASGIVWKVGAGVRGWKVGDEVVLHCNVTCGQCPDCNGGTPMKCSGQKIWGYETPNGSFAQYTCVQAQQVLPKPKDLTWEEAASYGLCLFTAYRMLINRAGLKPGEDVLIWGGSGGLGVFAVQLAAMVGARPIAVVSSEEKAVLAKELGAIGVIDRREFRDLELKDDETPEQTKKRMDATKAFGKKIWDILGEKKGPDVVFEHVGKSTFPASVFLANRFGRIVICGATTGFDLTFDVRHLWMHQKSIIGSHFANAGQCNEANRLVMQGKIKPVLTRTFTWDEIPLAHDLMLKNQLHGTVACLVGAPRPGMTTLR